VVKYAENLKAAKYLNTDFANTYDFKGGFIHTAWHMPAVDFMITANDRLANHARRIAGERQEGVPPYRVGLDKARASRYKYNATVQPLDLIFWGCAPP
jgi:hypothetical protein